MIPGNAAERLWSLPFPDFDSVLVSVRRESWLLKNGLRDTGITCENYTQESHARGWGLTFSPVHSARKFSHVFGVTSSQSSKMMRP